jgi:hypothetical protein
VPEQKCSPRLPAGDIIWQQLLAVAVLGGVCINRELIVLFD